MIRKTGVGFLLSLVFVLFAYSSAVAEWYVGGALGVAIPHTVDDIKSTGSGWSGVFSGITPDNALAGGIKGGYFFESIPYLGVEANWGMSAPDVSEQPVNLTVTGTATGFASGQTSDDFILSADVDSASSFGFLAMLRVTDENTIKELYGIQPFLGLGFAVTTIDVDSATLFNTAGAQVGITANSDSSTDVGLLLSAGLNYTVSDNIKVYSEYRFHAVDHTLTMDTSVSTEMSGESSSVGFGASYSF